jgi:uncharacterized protein
VPVKVTQTTAFPASDEMRLTVAVSRPSEFGIQLRAPGWLAAPIEAKVNGAAANLPVSDRHWAGLSRRWRNGDVISVRLPMKLWVSRLDPRRSTPAAVLHGPVVLAFEAPSARLLQDLDLTALEQALTPVAGEPLRYRLAGKPSVVARPFASYVTDQRYFVYLDPEMRRRIPHPDLRFTGPWNNAGAFRFSNQVGATVEGQFEGTGVRWLGYRFNDAGTAQVSIDGRVAGIVDQYGPGRNLPFDWTHRGLPPGPHTIRIRILAQKADASSTRTASMTCSAARMTPVRSICSAVRERANSRPERQSLTSRASPCCESPTKRSRSSRSEAGQPWSTGMEMGTSTSSSADTTAP